MLFLRNHNLESFMHQALCWVLCSYSLVHFPTTQEVVQESRFITQKLGVEDWHRVLGAAEPVQGQAENEERFLSLPGLPLAILTSLLPSASCRLFTEDLLCASPTLCAHGGRR